ncbi:MAG TPA: hypothetical protein VEO95_13495, partial [Chthoniobacteraceae bacterium]|nr:hypothetical protein [Chthoniobacteraceae bacterium]
MRAYFVVIILGAVAYLGWVFHQELTGSAVRAFSKTAPAPTPAAAPQDGRTPLPPPASDTSQLAPPGTFYIIQRVAT